MTAATERIAELTPPMNGIIEAFRARGASSYREAGIAESRQRYLKTTAAAAWEPSSPVIAQDRELGPERTRIRVYRPANIAPAGHGTMVYFHGGGFLMGDLDTHDSVCRELTALSDLPVVAVDYPLAPEHPFPAAPTVAVKAILQIVEAASELGVDASQIALVGDSAGACLSAVASVHFGRSMGIAAQCLFYPPTDLHCATASFEEISSGYPVSGVDGRWFTEVYLGDGGNPNDWRGSPLLSDSLADSPPTFLVTAGHDPLRDEGIAFGERLASEGVPLVHRHLPALAHGFLTMGLAIPDVRRELSACAQFVRRAFADSHNPATHHTQT